MASIEVFKSELLNGKVLDFYQHGGAVHFSFFKIDSNESRYQKHFETARNTLIEISQTLNLDILEKSGIEITLGDFLGPNYDLTNDKPIIRGRTNDFLNSYFYYDKAECNENVIDYYQISKKYIHSEFDGATLGFTEACLEPPYTFQAGKTIFEQGTYFKEFCNLLFSDLGKLEVYKWSVNSSDYFDEGKEWWGAHFWTAYNPIRNIYIGIAASTSD